MNPSRVSELFCYSTENPDVDWSEVVAAQQCLFLKKKCIKNRKSEPQISIGTCTVKYGQGNVIIQGFLIKTECAVLVYTIRTSYTLWVLPFVDKCAGRLVKHTQN